MTDRIAFKSAGAKGPRSPFPARQERMMATELAPITVTIQQAQALSGLSHTTIYKLIGLGKLKAVKIGRRTLVIYASLRDLLKAA